MRRLSALLPTTSVLCATSAICILAVTAAPAPASGTTYTPGTPVVDEVSGGPWNTSQGDPSAGTAYPESDLLPMFKFGGPETTLGGVSEPNVAVYAGSGSIPYPSGVAGTPGPLDGYCSSGGANPETGSPVSQPAGTTLPFAPYYFPDVVRNADGSLTGYFDYRPKDADEAITVARSTDNGKTWTTEGKALDQNQSYCPTADTNDDGQGHPFAASVNGTNRLYTLERSAGDYAGVGLLVHSIGANNSADPLSGLPEDESSGVDPNTFATAETKLSTTATNIPVTTLGSSQGPNTIVAGPYVDYSKNSPTSGSAPTVITCKGTTTSPTDELTECTVPSGSFTVEPNDDLAQVMEQVSKAATVPAGPNIPSGEKETEKIRFAVNSYGYADTTSNSNALAWLMNNDAPNRVYIDGHTVYCFTTNTNPITTNLQNCTSPSGAFSVAVGNAITGDPITPPNAQMTTGLVSPDGIVGAVPYTSTFNGQSVPSNATIMLYTEKIVNYFLEGEVNGGLSSAGTTYTKGNVTLPGGATSFGLNYQPYPGTSEPLPASGSFNIYVATGPASGTATALTTITCTGWNTMPASNAPPNSVNVTGCTGGSSGAVILGTASTNTAIGGGQGDWVGGPNAAAVPYSVLSQTGEGSDGGKSSWRLFGNNEDYTALRAAYTTNGVNFTDLGQVSGTSSGSGSTSGSYTDLANPLQQNSPENSANPTVGTTSPTSPTNLSPGSADTIELRYIGSRGTIVQNPDGSLGMFLSGSWPSDGDSDAFNQIFYATSTNGGQTWSVPKVVLSTEYEFNASREQDEALAHEEDKPLGISAYYSGRAYGPAVVQNPNGTLTMVFSGYRLPKPVGSAGNKLGTNSSAQYTIGTKDPAIYRNILTMQLTSSTSPGVATTTAVSSSDAGTGSVGAPVTYTATVAPVSPGTGTPTGTVSFSDSHGPISGCSEAKLNEGSPDTATCTTTHETPAGSDEVTATYAGDSNYAGSSGETTENVTEAPAITSGESATFTEGSEGSFEVTATGNPTPAVTESGTLPEGVSFDSSTHTLSGTPTQEGVFHVTFEASNGVGSPAVQSFTLTVDAAPTITSEDGATFTEGHEGSFKVSASGTPAPSVNERGTLPEGVSFDPGTGELTGTPAQEGVFHITVEASNGVGSPAVQSFTLTVDAAPAITSEDGATFTEGSSGSFTVMATGFPTPTVSESGTLPKGVEFDPFNDELSGTPTQEGVFHIAFKASNGVGSDAVQQFTLTVDAPPHITSPAEATFNDHMASEFAVVATGTPAPTISRWGNLPAGVMFSDGVLSGTPTETGTFEITFTASNGVGADATQRFTLTVVGLHITTAALPEATPGQPYSQQLEASGGVTPYKWSAHGLPTGLKLSSTGVLSGTVSARKYPHGGSASVTVKVADSTRTPHQHATATFTLNIS